MRKVPPGIHAMFSEGGGPGGLTLCFICFDGAAISDPFIFLSPFQDRIPVRGQGKRQFRRCPRYSRIGFSMGFINKTCGELTASPYIELRSDLNSCALAGVISLPRTSQATGCGSLGKLTVF